MRLRLSHLVLICSGALCFATSTGLGDETETDAAQLAAEEEKLSLLDRKLAALEDELAGLSTRESTLLGELHRLDVQTRVATQQIALLELHLERGYREMEATLQRIQELEANVAELLPFLTKRFRSLYKLGRLSYLRLLLSVEEPSSMTRAYRYISRLAREDGAAMARFREDEAALERTKAELVSQTERLLTTREQLEATRKTLVERRASRQALLAEVGARREMAATLAFELEQARAELSRLVEELSSGISSVEATVHLPMRLFEGEIEWPAEGELEGRFGRQVHPRFRTVTVRNGIEIDAAAGGAVHAVYQGEVVYASWFEGYGKLLILQHPGAVHTLYGYLAEFEVEPGTWVEKGQRIGMVGDTGAIAEPRLYFEIRVDGQPVDPEAWLHPSRRLARASPPAP